MNRARGLLESSGAFGALAMALAPMAAVTAIAIALSLLA